MVRLIEALGANVISRVARFGSMCLFFSRLLISLPVCLLRPRLIINQVYSVGVRTFLIITVSGLFVGMVMGLQFYTNFVKYGAESQLGMAVALVLIRELGPVLTAILFAGRAGSALAAEIGLMKATDQLAAMEMMAVDPMHRVVAPRYLAGVVALPLLAAIFIMVGIYGAYFVGVWALGLDEGVFWSSMDVVSFDEDVLQGMIKSLVFALVVTWISLYEGYVADPTSEGVSKATTRAVVISSLTVLGLNFVLTSLMFN